GPLIILAVGAVGVGIALGPTHYFERFLDAHWIIQFKHLSAEHATNWMLVGISAVIALAGIGVAYWMYVVQPAIPGQIAEKARTLFELSRDKFYFDELYDIWIVKPMTIFSHVCRIVDLYLLDGLVDLIGQVPSFGGYLVRPLQ